MADTEVKEKKKRRPGGGRKKKESTQFKTANQKFINAAPQLAEAAINRAIGGPIGITCPKCRHKFEYLIPGAKSDAKLLEYANDRVHGKPVVKQEIGLNAKIDMPNQQLAKYHVIIIQTMDAFKQLPTGDLENEVVKLPEKPKDFVEGEIIGTS
jgi:hypothetical protein